MTNPAPTVQIPGTIDEVVAQYVKLRDAIKAAEDANKAKLAAAKSHLDTLGNKLLEQLNAIGGDSVKTSAGTAYRTTRRSASTEDGETFRRYIIENEAYEIVDWKPNANAVDDFIASNGSPPPGVKFSMAFTVGVRRA